MEANLISTSALQKSDRFSRAIVYTHLLGVGAIWVASCFDRAPMHGALIPAMFSASAVFGLLTFIFCPVLAIWLSTTGRLSGLRASILLILMGLIEALQMLAMLPLVQ